MWIIGHKKEDDQTIEDDQTFEDANERRWQNFGRC